MCLTDRHDMTLAVKVALNLNSTNQHQADQRNQRKKKMVRIEESTVLVSTETFHTRFTLKYLQSVS